VAVVTYRQALHDTLRAELRRDDDVVLLGEEIGVFEGSYKITAGLLQEFGRRRIWDTPIAEEGFVGVGIGAAMLGLRTSPCTTPRARCPTASTWPRSAGPR
jgi:pyruvate dehydrogenase E1 component beta subunit